MEEVCAGVYAEGRRGTRVIRAGSEGNDRDISVVTKTWISPELHLDVLRKVSDPKSA